MNETQIPDKRSIMFKYKYNRSPKKEERRKDTEKLFEEKNS